MEFPQGLGLGVICEREDPSDAFVSNRYAALEDLPENAVVGTSSLRRECQLRERRPDLTVKFLRGNVNSACANWMMANTTALFWPARDWSGWVWGAHS